MWVSATPCFSAQFIRVELTDSGPSHVGNDALNPVMAKAHDTTAACVLVGIDISKHRHEVLIAVPDKRRRRQKTVMNTAADYQRLI